MRPRFDESGSATVRKAVTAYILVSIGAIVLSLAYSSFQDGRYILPGTVGLLAVVMALQGVLYVTERLPSRDAIRR